MTFKLALFGAPPDTPNMGVSALFASAIEGLTRELGDVSWVVFDNGLGRRTTAFSMAGGTNIALTLFGARVGRRYYRPENLAAMRLAARFGSLGAWLNEGVRLIDSCDAVLDVSGGDSFSDIYGLKRFSGVHWPKQIALSRGKPLLLMPQTYGPFRDVQVLSLAKSATRGAAMAWARDSNSFEELKRLLGPFYAPEAHREGVDMAFTLAAREPAGRIPPVLASWLSESPRSVPLVGVNVSGLIYNDPARAKSNYRFVADYRSVVTRFVALLLKQTTARIVLISHVMDRPGHYESDIEACQCVAEALPEGASERVFVAPIDLDQSEAKWLISRLDWFCGTRMHSTIAGLSSGVPTAAIAYSDKTRGVFATCGVADQVFDPRAIDTDGVIAELWAAYQSRSVVRATLLRHLPAVLATARGQMRDIAACVRATASRQR
ncbi:MAG TPA: polysaccharide pyruvyl transferase family protein [Pyrinomonadaceae bacterium]|nr:polysaccharide pyruvyl transferase family protein [Pyrinomonadaceae bacterium]